MRRVKSVPRLRLVLLAVLAGVAVVGLALAGPADRRSWSGQSAAPGLLDGGVVDPAFCPRPNGPVGALAVSGGRLFVGGDFSRIAGALARSSALRWSTFHVPSPTVPMPFRTSSRNARIEVSCSDAEYVVGARSTTSATSSRLSSSHFLRPPSSSLTYFTAPLR